VFVKYFMTLISLLQIIIELKLKCISGKMIEL